MQNVESRKQKKDSTSSNLERLPSAFCKLPSRGFTLVELLVSVFIFSMVMLIAAGSLLSMIDANRKAQALKSVVNNLAFALDAMGRSIREGSTYHCGAAPYTTTADCAAGSTEIAFEPYGGSSSNPNDQIVFRLVNGRIERSLAGGQSGTWFPITAPEVTIEELHFYVKGSAEVEVPKVQPKIVMTLRGYAGVNTRSRTEITLQTTMTPRLFDQ